MADIGRDHDVIDEDLPTAAPAEEPGVIDEDAAAVPAGEEFPAHAVLNDDGTVLLPLRYPVTLRFKRGGEEREERVAELLLHRLTGRDRRLLAEAKPARMTETAVRLSARLPEIRAVAVYDRMDAADIEAAERVVLHFLGNGRRTGR